MGRFLLVSVGVDNSLSVVCLYVITTRSFKSECYNEKRRVKRNVINNNKNDNK